LLTQPGFQLDEQRQASLSAHEQSLRSWRGSPKSTVSIGASPCSTTLKNSRLKWLQQNGLALLSVAIIAALIAEKPLSQTYAAA
jgi:hypothetical protein